MKKPYTKSAKSQKRPLTLKEPGAVYMPRRAKRAANAKPSVNQEQPLAPPPATEPVRKRTFPPPGVHVIIYDMKAVLK